MQRRKGNSIIVLSQAFGERCKQSRQEKAAATGLLPSQGRLQRIEEMEGRIL